MKSNSLLRLVGLAAGAALTLGLDGFAAAESTAGPERFGFTGPEIYPIENLIAQLRSADLDGDGRPDLAVVNNARSKITFLLNQNGVVPEARSRPAKREVNELPPDARFRVESIASEKRISALVVADLNQDERPDLAYFGEPKELVVQYNQGTNSWGAPKRWTIEDGVLDANALASGDLNGDGLPDLAMLGENSLYTLIQKPDHTLAEPDKVPYSGSIKAVQILDIDGDGRSDLLLVNWEHANPFRFRLQGSGGQLGPEIHFALPAIRSYCADDLDGDRKTEVITIAMKSGRAQISHFVQKPPEPLSGAFAQGQLQVLPLAKTTKNRRGLTWADLNRDGLADLLVAEPESGQLALFLQQPDGAMANPRRFPTLTGVTEVEVADWDEDGQAEIFLLSLDERQIGVSRLEDNGRIGFPSVLSLEGRPLAMTVGTLGPGRRPVLACVCDRDGKRELIVREAGGDLRRQNLSESFKSNPSAMAIHDLDHDGRPDLVILTPYEKIKVLLQVADGPFDEQDVAPPGGSAEQPWLSAADVDGDGRQELLLAQKNFVRAVVLSAEPAPKGSTNRPTWSFKVREQINGASGSSRIVGAAALTNGTNALPSLFLLDAERRSLTLCERDSAGVWQVTRSIPLPVTEFASLRPLALGGTNANAVAFLGLNAAAWLPLQGPTWQIEELDDYETPIKDGYLHDVVAGDLNHDGRRDLVFLETGRNHLDIVTFESPHRLIPSNRWQVFEERTFKGRRSEIPEPREALIVDLTGDGRNDLAVLVHDRVLVYPQE